MPAAAAEIYAAPTLPMRVRFAGSRQFSIADSWPPHSHHAPPCDGAMAR